jgi:MFS transporter, BCD family, chlorophyll transporter
MTPGASTKLAGVQHGGVLAGMVFTAVVATAGRGRAGSLRAWTVGGCIASAAALVAIALGGFAGPAFPLRGAVFLLGAANGVFAVSAIGAMMGVASAGGGASQGTRMGVFGAAQAVAFGAGGFLGALAADVARGLLGDPVSAYATVFILEAVLFVAAAALGLHIAGGNPAAGRARVAATAGALSSGARP